MVEPRKLSDAEEKILKAIAMNTEQRMTPSELAEASGVQLRTLYRFLQDDYFKDLWIATLQKTVSAEVPSILNSFAMEAGKGSFRHGKLLLEIAGAYTEKTQTDAKVTVDAVEKPWKTDEERDALLKALVEKQG